MAIERIPEHTIPGYSALDVDRGEGKIINDIKVSSQPIIADPDQWLLENELKQNVLLTTVDAVINWGQRSALW